MYKFGEDPIGEKILDDFKERLAKDEIKYAMLAYVDNEGSMYMFGDTHSITMIVSNVVMQCAR